MSPHRTRQAAETQRAVLEGARAAFVHLSWQKATIAVIAQMSGVSAETVYATFGNKRALLQAVIEKAVRGDQPETPLLEQPGPQSVRNAASQREQIRLFAADICRILGRAAPLVAVARTAAESDDEVASLYAGMHRGRRQNLAFVIDALLARGPLRVDRETAVTTLTRLVSPELFLVATQVEGASPDGYERWLRETLSALLLPPSPNLNPSMSNPRKRS